MNITINKNNILSSYSNGNTNVTILNDGTKIREYYLNPNPLFPESIDVKITNYCDLNCPYCHENSNKNGSHANLMFLYNKLNELYEQSNKTQGIELAIGGGNPLAHPHLYDFLKEIKGLGFIANITVNQKHVDIYYDDLVNLINEKLIYGVGISITNTFYISESINKLNDITDNVVFHLIAGVNDIYDIKILNLKNKFLILGYKTFGRGVNFYDENVENNLNLWRNEIRKYLYKTTISFDNLAIEQLELKKHFTNEAWKQFYMGDDFKFTMYIDAVKKEYAQTSRSNNRIPMNDYSIIDFFNMKI